MMKPINIIDKDYDQWVKTLIERYQQCQELSPIFNVPWGHHKLIMDKVKGDVNKALFYISQTLENGWSRSLLLNWIDTGLYERQGKAITKFKSTLPEPDSDLTQEITKDPYNFAFAGATKRHNEAELKLALLRNITDFSNSLILEKQNL